MFIKLTRTDQERPGQVIAIKTDSIVAIVPKWPRPEDGCVIYIGDRFTFQVEQTVEEVMKLIYPVKYVDHTSERLIKNGTQTEKVLRDPKPGEIDKLCQGMQALMKEEEEA